MTPEWVACIADQTRKQTERAAGDEVEVELTADPDQ